MKPLYVRHASDNMSPGIQTVPPGIRCATIRFGCPLQYATLDEAMVTREVLPTQAPATAHHCAAQAPDLQSERIGAAAAVPSQLAVQRTPTVRRACAGAAQPAVAARDGPQALRELRDRRGHVRREGDGRVRSSPAATAQTGRQGAEPAAADACAEPSATDGRCAPVRRGARQRGGVHAVFVRRAVCVAPSRNGRVGMGAAWHVRA